MDVAALFRAEADRARAGLARRLGDLDRAEDAVADAFVLALERWPRDGVPADPAAWIASTARNRAIDRIRRDRRGTEKHALLIRLGATGAADEHPLEAGSFGDDRLELLFGCIHPALEQDAQVALTLRALGGLTSDEVADAFFVERTTMQQRIVRAKAKIRAAAIPFAIPPAQRLGERLEALAAVLYLIFTTGYAPPRDDAVVRADLCETAIELCALVAHLLPERNVPHALEALMRFNHARRAARAASDGDIVLLADQDRSQWDAAEIARAASALRRALALPRCSYTFEAYIAAAHAHAPSFAQTDWDAIVDAYDGLLALHDTPTARCNRAVALAMRGDIATARSAMRGLERVTTMAKNRYYHVAWGEIAEREGNVPEAVAAFERALGHASQERDRRVIARRIERLRVPATREL